MGWSVLERDGRTRLGMARLRTLLGENGKPVGLWNGAGQLIVEWEDS